MKTPQSISTTNLERSLFFYFIIGAIVVSIAVAYLPLKLQIAFITISIFAGCLFFRKTVLFLFFVSFIAPVSLELLSFSHVSEFSHLGKSADSLRFFAVDFSLLMLMLSQSTSIKNNSVIKSSVRIPKDILFIIAYVLLSICSILWAVNKSAAFSETINLLKLLFVLIYFTIHHKLIIENIHLISKAFFVFILVQLLFCIMQIKTGQLLTISNLLGYNATITPEIVRFGFIRPFGSVGSLLPTFMGIIILWSYSFLLTEREKKQRLLLYILFMISFLILIISQSRTNLLGVILAMTILFIISKGIKFTWRIPFLFLAGFSLAWIVSKNIDVDYFKLNCVNTFLYRMQMDIATIKQIIADPTTVFFGFGQNNSIDNIRFFTTDMNNMPRLLPVHNFYLLEWSETGLIGVGLLMFYIAHNYYRVIRNRDLIMKCTPHQQSLYYFIIGMGIFLAINAASSWVLCFYELQLILVILLGSFFASLRQNIKIMKIRVYQRPRSHFMDAENA